MNKRRLTRRQVDTDEIPPRGMARKASESLIVPVNIIDYSRGGLGFWAPEAVTVGDVFELEFMEPSTSVKVVVAWCRPDEDSGFRGGFSAEGDGVLDELVEAFDERFF